MQSTLMIFKEIVISFSVSRRLIGKIIVKYFWMRRVTYLTGSITIIWLLTPIYQPSTMTQRMSSVQFYLLFQRNSRKFFKDCWQYFVSISYLSTRSHSQNMDKQAIINRWLDQIKQSNEIYKEIIACQFVKEGFKDQFDELERLVYLIFINQQ